MSDLFSFIAPKKEKPEAPLPPPTPEKKPLAEEKRGRKAQLIALKATGPRGLFGEENIGRRRILV